MTVVRPRDRACRACADAAAYFILRVCIAMADAEKHVYDESKIKTLSSLEHIRLRTGMYIGRVGPLTLAIELARTSMSRAW